MEKDMMMIKQEESWHEQLLEQQSRFFAASPLLERQRGERRALIGKLVKDFTVKINKEEQMDHKDVKMAQPEKSVRAQDPKTSSVQVIHSLSFSIYGKIWFDLIMVTPPDSKEPSTETRVRLLRLKQWFS